MGDVTGEVRHTTHPPRSRVFNSRRVFINTRVFHRKLYRKSCVVLLQVFRAQRLLADVRRRRRPPHALAWWHCGWNHLHLHNVWPSVILLGDEHRHHLLLSAIYYCSLPPTTAYLLLFTTTYYYLGDAHREHLHRLLLLTTTYYYLGDAHREHLHRLLLLTTVYYCLLPLIPLSTT